MCTREWDRDDARGRPAGRPGAGGGSAAAQRPGAQHGLVVPEVFGHTSFLGGHRAELSRVAMRNLFADVRHRIPAAP